MIINALEGKELPIYGDGRNIRDWLYVCDHVEALNAVRENGVPGEKYNIGGSCEKANCEVVGDICSILDEMYPQSPYYPHSTLIRFVKDRPGHDRRYAIDSTKVSSEIGWKPKMSFDEGLRQTIQWYIDNWEWVQSVRTGEYRDWIEANYRER
ncbi:MAG: GDP-mannose 4,6-dehydratase [Paludibacter sp.]